MSSRLMNMCVCGNNERDRGPEISAPIHLILKPQYVDQYHTFRSKIVRTPMPCDVCRQPIYREGSSCKVCKYVCHKTCEPRVYSSCDTPLHYPLSNDSLNSCSSTPPLISTLRKSQTFPTENNNVHLRDGRNKNRARFRPQTIEMDITFITEKIISMSFPMTGMDDSYRNSLLEVTKMLRTKHGQNYTIFNVSERRNDMSQFTSQLVEFGWPDPLAPPLERLCSICKAVDSWLNMEPQNVAVFHCKGGKERIAVVVAAYMHYSSICASADQALDRFAMKKFYNDKLGGLTTPSHKRYVNYFNGLLSGVIKINSNPLYLHQVILHAAPNFDVQGAGGCRLFVKVYQGMKPVFTSGVYHVSSGVRTVSVNLESPIPLKGDILVKGYHRRTRPDEREIVFRCQFHTCAVSEYSLSFDKEDLDDASFDNRFPDDGCLEFKFSPSPERHYVGIKDVSVPVDHTPDAIVRRDSYENLDMMENLYDSAYIIQPGASVNHTVGPLDGNPYATVAKKSPQENGLYNGGPHTASTDSGISSTTPPHSGRSGTSSGGGVQNGVFETRAEVHGANRPPPLNSEEQRKLDELLDGMMAQVETIPDMESRKSGGAGAHPVPAMTTNQPVVVVKRVTYSPETNGIDHGIEEDIVADDKDLPYHARDSSQPFSYLVPGSSPGMSRRFRPNVSPTTTITLGRRLNTTTVAAREKSPPPPPPPAPPQPTNPTPSISPTHPPHKSATLPAYQKQYKKERSAHDFEAEPDPSDPDYDGDPKNWLRRQQEKLRERQEAQYRRDRSPKERLLFDELRTAQSSRLPPPPPPQTTSSGDEDDVDGIIRQHQMPLYVNTYTNGPAATTNAGGAIQQQHVARQLQWTPSTKTRSRSPPFPPPPPSSAANPSTATGKPPIHGRGISAPNSPLIPSRSNSSREATRIRYPTWQGQGPTATTPTTTVNSKPLVRQRSDLSHDRERPFVAVMRAHDNANAAGKPTADPFAAISSSAAAPVYQNASIYRKPRSVNDDRSPGRPQGGLLTTVEQPRTSSPLSGPPREALLDFATVPSHRRSPHFSAADEEVSAISNWSTGAEVNGGSPQGDRPPTPGFPVHPRTPYYNQESTPPPQGRQPMSPTSSRKDRSPSPTTVQQIRAGFQPSDSHPQTANGGQSSPSIYAGQSRRSSIASLNEPSSSEVIHHHPGVVKDTTKYWYKPSISREDAINILKDKRPGTFLVRDSNSFPGAYGLALKVSSPPPNVQTKSNDISSELVRHFLIEPTSQGVKLKGCSNEPVFGTLSALVYQHSITPLALPCKLILPETDQSVDYANESGSQLQASQLLSQGAACSVLYLFTLDVESLTGPSAVKRAVAALLSRRPLPDAIVVHFKVSSQGITLTDSNRQLFFRRHYPVNSITHCGIDPDDRRWAKARSNDDTGPPVTTKRVTFECRVFGFVARKPVSCADNQCHLFAELEPEQPASAIVNFVTKVMMSGSASKSAVI